MIGSDSLSLIRNGLQSLGTLGTKSNSVGGGSRLTQVGLFWL